MVTQIVFKNGVEIIVDHDAAPALYRASMKEIYTAKTWDDKEYILSVDKDNILYKKTFACFDDYVNTIPV